MLYSEWDLFVMVWVKTNYSTEDNFILVRQGVKLILNYTLRGVHLKISFSMFHPCNIFFFYAPPLKTGSVLNQSAQLPQPYIIYSSSSSSSIFLSYTSPSHPSALLKQVDLWGAAVCPGFPISFTSLHFFPLSALTSAFHGCFYPECKNELNVRTTSS